MVTTIDDFEKSKEFFDKGDIVSAINSYEKAIEHIDRSKSGLKTEMLTFLNKSLEHCQKSDLISEEAMVLRAIGRTHTKFKNHVEGLKYSYQALKIQKKLGKKLDIAESLMFLAEDLEVSGNYDDCINTFNEAANVFKELGKLGQVKTIEKEVVRLKSFSKKMVEDEFYMQKFQVDNY